MSARRQLAVHHAVMAALLGVVIGAGFSVLQVGDDYRQSAEAERREIEQMMAVMREPAAQACYHLNGPAAQVVVNGALAYAPVQQATLVNDFGETLAQAGQLPPASGAAPAWWTRFTPPTQRYSLPLSFGPGRQRVGELLVTTSQAPRVERFLRGAWHELGLNVLRSVIVALALGVLSFVSVTRPLAAIARRIGSGLSTTGQPMPEAARQDEIGQIAAAFARYEREAVERTRSLEASGRALAASEVRHRRIVETASEGVWQWDAQGRTTLANQAMARMLGLTPEALAGRCALDFVVEEDRAAAQALLGGPVVPEGERRELRLQRSDGTQVWVEVSSCPVTDENGEHGGTLTMVTNATERRRRDDELRATNARLMCMVSDLERHKADMAQIVELNELLQSARTEAEAFNVIRAAGARLFSEFDGAFAVTGVQDSMVVVGHWGRPVCAQGQYERGSCWAIRRGGAHEQCGQHGVRCDHQPAGSQPGAVLCLPLYVEGQLIGVLHLHGPGTDPALDGSVRQRAEVLGEVAKLGLSNLRLRDTLREQALRDPLTGLPNRRLFDETLPRELAGCQRARQPLTLAVVDVDHFKRINDTYGHDAGDRVLRAVAQVLQQGIRASDMACRYGGDEFMCLLPGMSAADAALRFQQALARMADDHAATGLASETITFTVGVASAPEAGDDVDSLIRAADAALYVAKARGRNCVEVAPGEPGETP